MAYDIREELIYTSLEELIGALQEVSDDDDLVVEALMSMQAQGRLRQPVSAEALILAA